MAMQAISVRDGLKQGLDERSIATHCPYCALQCGMNLIRRNGVVSVAPREFPTNKGGLCKKGWTAAELLTNRERLTVPLVREQELWVATRIVGRSD